MLSVHLIQIQEYKARTNTYGFCAHLCKTQGLEEEVNGYKLNYLKVRIKFKPHV